MYYATPNEEEIASFGVEYLDDNRELQKIAAAFLSWQRTWSYGQFGEVQTDYTAAKESLERFGIDEKHIDTFYIMKLKWTGAQREQEPQDFS